MHLVEQHCTCPYIFHDIPIEDIVSEASSALNISKDTLVQNRFFFGQHFAGASAMDFFRVHLWDSKSRYLWLKRAFLFPITCNCQHLPLLDSICK
jgi:hypothetical protein